MFDFYNVQKIGMIRKIIIGNFIGSRIVGFNTL